MSDEKDLYKRLESIVIEAIKNSTEAERPEIQELLPFLHSIQKHISTLNDFNVKVNELQAQLTKLTLPPLEYGIFLGLAQEAVNDSNVNKNQDTNSTLWKDMEQFLKSVAAREQSPVDREKLRAIEEKINEIIYECEDCRNAVVGLDGRRYEVNLAAPEVHLEDLSEGQEVVLNKLRNIVGKRDSFIRGDTAEVVNILNPVGAAKVLSIPYDGGLLKVQWPEGDKFEVYCATDLLKSLHRGDIVQIDENKERVVRKVKPRLHVRSGASEGVVVEISEKLFEEGVEIGDIVRVDTRLQFAFEKLPYYETGGLTLEEVPDVTYENIGGLKEQVEVIRDAIELPYIHHSLFGKYKLTRPKGILLYGPPGCGKTMIAKAVANSLTHSIRKHLKKLEHRIQFYLKLNDIHADGQEQKTYMDQIARDIELSDIIDTSIGDISLEGMKSLMQENFQDNNIEIDDISGVLQSVQDILRREDGIRSYFLNVKGPELLNKYVGETEHRIRKIFEEARRRATFYTPVVIFFDEMEAMFRTRGSGLSSDVETTIVPQFLSEMDGVEASENVIIIGASNRQDMIDPAIIRPGRLDIKVKIDRPDCEAAMQIMALYLTPNLPLLEDGLETSPQGGLRIEFSPSILKKTIEVLDPGMTDDLMEALLEKYYISSKIDVKDEVHHLSGNMNHRSEIFEKLIKQVKLAEVMINKTVTSIFSPSNRLDVVTGRGLRYTFPLREFVSGAMIASVVSRAKKKAVKRESSSPSNFTRGITIADLLESLKEEFEDNAEQLTATRLEQEMGFGRREKPGEVIKVVDVHIEDKDADPWNVEKIRPYRE